MDPIEEKRPFLCDDNQSADDEEHSLHDASCGSLRSRWTFFKSPYVTHALVFILALLLWAIPALVVLGRQTELLRQLRVLESSTHRPHNSLAVSTSFRTPVTSQPKSGNFTATARLITCGNSTLEAMEAGCRYDILSNHWVPAVCMDESAVTEYKSDGSWYGFADEEHTELLSIEEMGQREFYFTNERDHIVHCAMLWRKQFRAFYEERPNIDTLIGSVHHTMHCSQFLIDMSEKGPDFRAMPIKTFVGYAGCWMRE